MGKILVIFHDFASLSIYIKLLIKIKIRLMKRIPMKDQGAEGNLYPGRRRDVTELPNPAA